MVATPATARPSRQAALLPGLGLTISASLLLWLTGAITGQFALLPAGAGVLLPVCTRAAISRGERRALQDAGIMVISRPRITDAVLVEPGRGLVRLDQHPHR